MIVNEECEELSVSDGVVTAQYVKSLKVGSQSGHESIKNEFGESPSSLQVDSPDPHPFACVMLYSVALRNIFSWLGSSITINREILLA